MPVQPVVSSARARTRIASAVGVAAVVALDPAGRVAHLEVVVGAAGDRPQRVQEGPGCRARGAVFDDGLVTAVAGAVAQSVETVSWISAPVPGTGARWCASSRHARCVWLRTVQVRTQEGGLAAYG